MDVDPSPATTALIADIERGATAPGWSVARSGFVAKPTIVVFPFDDLSPNRDQDHFACGLVAEIIAALSCMKSLSVVARDSDRASDADQVARKLGADYALRGCVRVAGVRMRIATQLIDACTGDHLWTGRSDHAVRDVFAMQEMVAAKIAASVEPYVYAAEGVRAGRRPLHALDARGCVMRAISLVNIRSRRNYAFAEELLKRAIEIDPACAHAYSLYAYVIALEVVYGWRPRESTMATAREVAHNAVLLDVDAPWSHFALGYVHAQSRWIDEAIAAYEKALALNPNFGLAHTYLGSALSVLGRSEAALAQIDVAERLSAREIFHGVNNYVRANAHFAAGRYREACLFARNSVRESPGIVTSHRHVVVNCALAGAIPEAKAALDELLRLGPGTSLRAIDEALPYVREQDRNRFLDAFHRVGID